MRVETRRHVDQQQQKEKNSPESIQSNQREKKPNAKVSQLGVVHRWIYARKPMERVDRDRSLGRHNYA